MKTNFGDVSGLLIKLRQLLGTNSNRVNACFIRKDLAKELFPSPETAENLYNSLKLHVRYVNGHPAKKCIL
jgi:hypothetical protein